MRESFALALLLVVGGSVSAGPVLDDILNYMFLDQTTSFVPRGEMFEVQRTMNLTKDAPMGQTFMTGPDTDRIVPIRTYIAPDADWQPGEGVELVLWESPEKKVALGRCTIWYEYRGFMFNKTEFEVNARAKPSTKYYFELSYVGNGDGKLSKVGLADPAHGYSDGQGYVAGKEADFNVCFQTLAKRAPDPIGNLKKAFARFNLDLPELAEVKQAVDKEDFDTASEKIVYYFEHRQKPAPVIDPKDVLKLDPSFDTTEANRGMANYFPMGRPGDGYAGPDLNWRGSPAFNPDGTSAATDWHTHMNRYNGPCLILATAYLSTGNEKYARKLNDVLIDWYLDNPPPAVSKMDQDGIGSVWATLQAGFRLGTSFRAYSQISSSTFFTRECRFAYILNMADQADTLIRLGAGDGGNWAYTQNGSMYVFAKKFPEYRNAETWRKTALDRLALAVKRDILPDGVEMESAPGYQRMGYYAVVSVLEQFRTEGAKEPFAEWLRDVLEKQAEYFMYLTSPGGRDPYLGDWGNKDLRPVMLQESKRYGRQDMLYVATAGKEGVKPKELSKLYPYAGLGTLRSDWGDAGRPYEDGRYLFIHSAHYGAHGHADLNEVTAYAYGRLLLGDPGCHVYGSPEHAFLCSPQAHNVMTIDDEKGYTGYPVPSRFKNWGTTPVADYSSSWVKAYKGGDYNREVFYVRSNGDPGAKDYWIIRDIAEGAGTHSLEQRWHFDPSCELKADQAALTAKTMFDQGGNLCIMQVDPSRLKMEQSTIDTWWPRLVNEDRKQMPTVTFTTSTALPAAFDTVLFPYEGKEMPQVQLKSLAKSPDGMDSAFKLVQGKVDDLFVMRKSAGAKSLASEKVEFDGERLFLRRVGGKPRSALLVNGSSLTVDGKQVVGSAKPLSWVAISFDRGGVKAWASSSEPTLTVSAPNGRKATVTSMNTDALLPADPAKK